MTDHYYSKNPSAISKPKMWNYTLRGCTFTFKTDQGVFSKNEVDFGTRLLIETFQLPNIDGPLLDMGCGYGPIGITLAKTFPDRFVHMVDINQRALELAKENAALNNIKNVSIYESEGFSNINEPQFAAILSNPPIRAGKKIVHTIFEESALHLHSNGELWIVIQKKQGAPSAKKKLEELFAKVETVKKDKGYYIFCAKKV